MASGLTEEELRSIDIIVAGAPPLTPEAHALLKAGFGPAMAQIAAEAARNEQADADTSVRAA
jgi:hypothetical protein